MKQQGVRDDVIEFVLGKIKYVSDNEPYFSGVVSVFNKQDLVGQELKNSFLEGVKMLENIPKEQWDWHPGR